MSFVDHLRSRKKGTVAGPTSFRYSAEAWTAAFDEHSTGDARDVNAYEAGQFFFHRLARLRATIDDVETHMAERDGAAVADRLASVASTTWAKLMQEELAAPIHKGFSALEHFSTRRFSMSPSHAGYTSVEMMEGTVDALRFPLSRLMKCSRFGVARPKLPELGLRDGVNQLVRLANLYSMYERSWDQVLWFDAELSLHPNGSYTLTDGGSPLAQEAAQDLARRSFSYQRDLRRLVAQPRGHRGVIDVFPYLAENGSLSAQLLFSLNAQVREGIILVCLQRSILIDDEVHSVLIKGFLPGTDISIRDALNVHLQLAVIATQLVSTSLRDDGSVNESMLDRRFNEERLTAVISACTRLSPGKVRNVMSALMFEPSRSSDLWSQPLVRTQRGIALIAPALVSIDIKRLIAAWCKEYEDLQPAHSARGHAFAAQVHEVLSLVASRSRLPDPVNIAGPNLDIPGSDVDCLLVYGDTAYVLECRICRHAASPFEHWAVDSEMRGKIAQVTKQCDYLRDSPSVIERWTGVSASISQVVGLVVTNSFMHEGAVLDGVRFIHVDTLAHLVAYGGALFGVVDKSCVEQLLRSRAIGSDAPAAFLDAVSRGDKAQFYRANLALIRNPMPSIPGGGNPGEIWSWVVALPSIGDMWEHLHQMPFASHLESVDRAAFGDV